MKTIYWLVAIMSGVDPRLYDPVGSHKEMIDLLAEEVQDGKIDSEDCVFYLKMQRGKLSIGYISGKTMERLSL